jgi:hypothetical protein
MEPRRHVHPDPPRTRHRLRKSKPTIVVGRMRDGTAAHPRQPAGPAPQPLRIGATTDLLRIPTAAAAQAGAITRPNPGR